ncbi:MAG: hypothetical protein LBG43_02415 [Treponema sp.]|nr:hypothetical protein [Treponema sp.]
MGDVLHSPGQFAEGLAYTREAAASYIACRTKITFDVDIEEDRDGRKLSSIFESNGYICDPHGSAYTIQEP